MRSLNKQRRQSMPKLKIVKPESADKGYQFNKGIPIPPMKVTRRIPWREMEIGDSVFMPGRKIYEAYNTTRDARKRHNFVFACRTTVEEGIEGIRIWRVK
jgi:hypothetical protein